jgi:N-methylhydantoinase A
MESLRRHVVGGLAAYGVVEESVGVSHRLDLRFEGQEHSVTVPIDAVWLQDHPLFLAGARERFVTLHRQLYGHGDPDGPIEVVTVRCRCVEAVDRPRWPAWDVQGAAEPRAWRPVHFGDAGGVETPVFDRDRLALGQMVVGPAIVEEWTTTIVVPPGWEATTDHMGNLVMERP